MIIVFLIEFNWIESHGNSTPKWTTLKNLRIDNAWILRFKSFYWLQINGAFQKEKKIHRMHTTITIFITSKLLVENKFILTVKTIFFRVITEVWSFALLLLVFQVIVWIVIKGRNVVIMVTIEKN